MNTEHFSSKQSFLLLIIILIASTFVIPAKWLGIQPIPYAKINLGDDLTPMSKLQGDSNKNNNPDWRDLAMASLGTTTKEALATIKIDPAVEKNLSDPNNLTASFSKNMYITSAYLQKNGGGVASDQKQLVTSMLQQEATKIVIPSYALKDITIAKVDNDETKRQYGNALGGLIQNAATYKMGEGDIEIVRAYTTSKDASLLSAFTVKKDRADIFIQKLLVMPVPYSAIPYHILALNRLSQYRTILDNFSKLDSDPVRSTISFNSYIPTIKSVFVVVSDMHQYFKAENIKFTEKESGYMFTREYIKQ